jgi:hypothetical protein
MWEMYGQTNGVAIVIDTERTGFTRFAPHHNPFHPVEYVADCRKTWVDRELLDLAQCIRTNECKFRHIAESNAAPIVGHLMQAFRTAVLRTKKHKFAYEREWRIVRTEPWIDLLPASGPYPYIIKGRERQVLRLSLDDYSSATEGGLNFSLNHILKEVIVARSHKHEAVKRDIVAVLNTAGVLNAECRVRILE